MKNSVLFIVVMISLFIHSCRSVEKLVDQGRYDEAIFLAAEKLAGKKNPKTKHLMALERAFEKVNTADLHRIEYFRSLANPAVWPNIYTLTEQIDRRQQRVMALLPLRNKENYAVSFDFVNVAPLKSEAANRSAEYHYELGREVLDKADEDRSYARKAYREFDKIYNYLPAYKDIQQLMKKAHQEGTTYVLVDFDHANSLSIGKGLTLKGKDQLDRFWVKYFDRHERGIVFDLIARLYVDAVDISPEQEIVNTLVETKTEEKWIDVTDEDGKVVKDSSGQVIQTKEIFEYRARVRENLVDEEIIELTVDFYSDSFSVSGDREALSDRIRKSLDGRIEPFPTDQVMLLDATNKLLIAYQDFVKNIK